MKTFSLIITLLVMTVAISSADFKSATVFNNTSTAGSTVYSTPIDMRGSLNKSVQVTGANMATKAEAALSGTFLLQCGPTNTGPWVTCKDTGANAVTTTSNTIFHLSNAVLWVRGSWTKTAGRVKAWLTY